MKVWYYAFTTLSTIGFGDFAPKSIVEKFIISFVLMLGVSVFSYIMGNFIEIVLEYKFSWSGRLLIFNTISLVLERFHRWHWCWFGTLLFHHATTNDVGTTVVHL